MVQASWAQFSPALAGGSIAASSPEAMTAPARPTLSAASAARFRSMVDSNFNFVWRYVRGLGVPEALADDAAQQVFMVAAKKIDSIAEGRERSFLVGTALGIAANVRRSSARRHEVADAAALSARVDDAPNPEERIQTKQALALLDRFLESLPDDLRTVFILFELEGMTMAAMAEALDLPQGTVASRLRRAREEFSAMVKRYQAGLSHPPSQPPSRGAPS